MDFVYLCIVSFVVVILFVFLHNPKSERNCRNYGKKGTYTIQDSDTLEENCYAILEEANITGTYLKNKRNS